MENLEKLEPELRTKREGKIKKVSFYLRMTWEQQSHSSYEFVIYFVHYQIGGNYEAHIYPRTK